MNDDAALAKLAARFGVSDLAAMLVDDKVKECLRKNTDPAMMHGAEMQRLANMPMAASRKL